MCKEASKQILDRIILPRRDRAPPRFEIPGSAPVGGNCPLTSPNWTAARLTSTSLPIGCYCMGVTKTRNRKRNGKRNETENTAHVLA